MDWIKIFLYTKSFQFKSSPTFKFFFFWSLVQYFPKKQENSIHYLHDKHIKIWTLKILCSCHIISLLTSFVEKWYQSKYISTYVTNIIESVFLQIYWRSPLDLLARKSTHMFSNN